jgi:hypothetical protein
VQDEQLIRAAQPLFFDRLTNRNSFSITIRTQKTGYRQSLHSALMGRQLTPGIGALKIELVDGATVHAWTAARAKWAEMSSQPSGASLLVTYKVETGIFTYSTTDAEEEEETVLGGRDLSTPATVGAVGGRQLLHTASATHFGGRTLT